MRTTPTLAPTEHDQTIAAWKSPAAAGATPHPAHPAADVRVDDVLGAAAGGDSGWPSTNWVCLTIVSTGLSCGQCDTTLWKGTCGVSTVGCCKEPE